MAVVYLERDGQQFGPFALAEAQRYIDEGRFSGTDIGWIDGMREWQPISEITQLQFAATPITSVKLNTGQSTTPNPSGSAVPAYPGAAHNPYAAPQSNLAGAQPFAGQSEFAGFWRRAAAFAVDSIIVFILLYVLFIALAVILGLGVSRFGANGFNDGASLAVWLLFFALPMLSMTGYYALWNASKFMASPGKMTMGLIVVNAQAQRLHFLQACLREFVKIIGTWLLLITFAAQPLSARRQALHDMASASVVLRTSNDAGMPSFVVWILNVCTYGLMLLLIGVFMIAGR